MDYETLFDPDFPLGFGCEEKGDDAAAYFTALTFAEGNEKIEELEGCFFSHIAEHEAAYYEPRGQVWGPLAMTVDGTKVDAAASDIGVRLPTWMEEDGLTFDSCDATAVFVFGREREHRVLAESKVFHGRNVLLFSGSGVPRAGARRFLHRLSKQMNLPVYLVADNDTWGYFTYSVLARGLLWPKRERRQLAVPGVRYLGIRAGEFADLEAVDVHAPWRPVHTKRMAAMRRFPCFASPEWQAEFDLHERLQIKTQSWAVSEVIGPEAYRDYLLAQIRDGRWLGLPSAAS